MTTATRILRLLALLQARREWCGADPTLLASVDFALLEPEELSSTLRKASARLARGAATAAALLLVLACGREATSINSSNTNSAAPLECRSPTVMGCEECCEPAIAPGDDSSICFVSSRISTPAVRNAPPGYNDRRLEFGHCPTTCRRCAACTEEKEYVYRDILAKGCDCSKVTVSMDPCFGSGSRCECACSRYDSVASCRRVVGEAPLSR